MAKIFQFDNSKVERRNQAEAMDASAWFFAQQPLLLWMANKSRDGRKLLRLDQVNLPRIDRIAMNHVGMDRYVRDGGTLLRPRYTRVSTTDFRVGAKWANLVNSQWDWFCELAREYYSLMEKRRLPHVGMFMPVALHRGFAYGTTSTFNPAAGANSPVDGITKRVGVTESFATIRAGAGNASSATDATEQLIIRTNASSNVWTALTRGHFLFDTSTIPDADAISSAVFSLYVGSKSSGIAGCAWGLFSTAPAADNAMANGDHANVGTTDFATAIDQGSITTSAYNDWTLNATGIAAISLTGNSKFGVREKNFDAAAGSPTWVSDTQTDISVNLADSASNDPKLVVTHAAPVTFNKSILSGQSVKRASFF